MSAPAAAARAHWAGIGESTFLGGMWFLFHLHRVLGRRPFRLCLGVVALYYWATRGHARRASRQYLQRLESAHGTLGMTPGRRHELRHFFSFGEAILDKLLAISGRYRFERVRFIGQAPLLRMIEAGQGAVFLTAHVGCLELCRAAAQRQPGLRLNVLVHTRHAERFNRLLHQLDPDSGVRLLQVTELSAATAAMLAEKVSQGEFVAIAADRVPVNAGRTTQARFLGHEAPFPVGPYVLAALLACPVYFLGCVREGDGHTVHFDRLAARIELPRARRDAVLAQHAAAFAQRLEALVSRSPYEWFNFFSFWGAAAAPRPRS